MTRFTATALDLSRLDPSAMFAPLSFETIRSERLADLKGRFEAAGIPWDVEAIEGDPAVVLQETGAWRELLTRQSIRDAQLDVLLAFSRGQWLDRMGDLFGTKRLDGELDDRFRARIQLAPEAFGAAGTPGGYIYHAASASLDVRDIGFAVLDRGTPRVTVELTVLGAAGNGVPSAATMEAVRQAITAKNVQLATDVVSLRAGVLVPYAIKARLYVRRGPDPTVIRTNATAAVTSKAESYKRLAGGVPASALIAALQVAGVDRVELLSPTTSIATERWQFASPSSIEVEVTVLND